MEIIKVKAECVRDVPWSWNKNLFFIIAGTNHAHYCESQHGFNCDCHCNHERKVTLSIKKGKKRILVKGDYEENNGYFTPRTTRQLAKLTNFLG